REWRNLLKISVAVSSAVALLAIAQKFVSLGSLLPQAERVYGTLGNAAFLAGYLIFNIFFAGYLALSSLRGASLSATALKDAPKHSSRSNYREIDSSSRQGGTPHNDRILFFVYCLLLIVNCLALLLTGTRGALLGLLAGTIFLLLAFGIFHINKSFKKYSFILLFSVLLLAGAAFIFRQNNFIQGNFFLQRLTSISLKETTAQNRLILWQSAWTSWQQFPILGWGPENFGTAINKNFDPRLAPYESWYDRAHNFIFDYGVTLGWLGLASYLALFGVALFSLKKLLRENFYTAAFFASLLIAYLVQGLFVFDVYVTFLMLFFLLALINFYNMSLRAPSRICGTGRSNPVASGINTGLLRPRQLAGPRNDVKRQMPLNIGKKIFLIILSILVVFSLYFFNLKPMSASSLSVRIFSLPPEDAALSTHLFEKILSLDTFASPEITYQIVLDYLSKANSAPQLTQNEEFYKLASAALTENIKRSPLQVKNYIALGWLDLYFSDRHLERINSAIEQAQRAQDLSPYKKEILLLLVAGYSVNNQPDKALEIVEQAEKINVVLGARVRQYWESLNKN
ncbi:O-antigen ligase family protein, partial [Patescibacteria group bacterium]|nr:O-antigen ligase family protein [Patescibacteria group bacterium]